MATPTTTKPDITKTTTTKETKVNIARGTRNEDPISGEPGAHPVGTGIGAAAAGLVGGAIGSAGGPVGTVAGAAIGAAAGGYAGHVIAEAIDPTAEDAYWRETYHTRGYASPSDRYEDFGPAYRLGWEGYQTHGKTGKTFQDVENTLSKKWTEVKGESSHAWDKAKVAAKDAWERVAGRSKPEDKAKGECCGRGNCE